MKIPPKILTLAMVLVAGWKSCLRRVPRRGCSGRSVGAIRYSTPISMGTAQRCNQATSPADTQRITTSCVYAELVGLAFSCYCFTSTFLLQASCCTPARTKSCWAGQPLRATPSRARPIIARISLCWASASSTISDSACRGSKFQTTATYHGRRDTYSSASSVFLIYN